MMNVGTARLAAAAGLTGLAVLLTGACDDTSTENGQPGGGSQGGGTTTTTTSTTTGTATGGAGGGAAGAAAHDCPPPGPNAEDELCSPDEDETECGDDLYCFYPGTPEYCTCCAPCRPWGEDCTSATPTNKAVHDAPDCPGPGNTTCFLGYCVTWLPD